jgi:hypothetical protein
MQKNKAEIIQNRLKAIHNQSKPDLTKNTYIFQNHKKHDFALPHKSFDGKKYIAPGQTFHGDEYFMMFVKTGDLRISKVIEGVPEPVEIAENNLNESVNTVVTESKEGVPMEKLILDQPDKVTSEGTVEHVVRQPQRVLKDHNLSDQKTPEQIAQDVLLNESPMSGIDIIN